MRAKTVGCHQPNFLPWLGFFAKMAHADVFILLDDVQFTQGHNKHNWTTRVRILSANGPVWLSVPVWRSGKGKQLIRDLRADPSDGRWLPKMLKTIEAAYGKTAHYAETMPGLLEELARHDGDICGLNVGLIQRIASMLELPTRLLRSSSLASEGAGNQRLVNLTQAEGGATYLSGDGADDYQVEEEFRAAGLRLEKLAFKHPEYPQRHGKEFVAGLSIVDALCNIGAAATRDLLMRSRGMAADA